MTDWPNATMKPLVILSRRLLLDHARARNDELLWFVKRVEERAIVLSQESARLEQAAKRIHFLRAQH